MNFQRKAECGFSACLPRADWAEKSSTHGRKSASHHRWISRCSVITTDNVWKKNPDRNQNINYKCEANYKQKSVFGIIMALQCSTPFAQVYLRKLCCEIWSLWIYDLIYRYVYFIWNFQAEQKKQKKQVMPKGKENHWIYTYMKTITTLSSK